MKNRQENIRAIKAAVILILGVTIFRGCFCDNSAATQPPPDSLKLDALAYSQVIVKNSLIAPETAIFGHDYKNDVSTVNDSTFYVVSRFSYDGLPNMKYKCIVTINAAGNKRIEGLRVGPAELLK